MSLSFEERRKYILEQLTRDERVKVAELAEKFRVSTETVRRDLDRLEKDGILKKVYGGAVKSRAEGWEPPFVSRAEMLAKEKETIGRLAASLVKDGETVMIDHGTTTLEVLRYLGDRKHVTVVTHSVPLLLLAMEMFAGRIIFIGGEVSPRQQSVAGPIAEAMLKQLKVNKAFISVGGISLNEGITDYDLNEVSISRLMIERAEEVVVLADHTKFGKITFANIAPLKDVSMIITDEQCPEEWMKKLTEKGIEVLVPVNLN
ncbi:DeoR/GlpR family DNA-binding transcription regulator [Paenibacillus cisolokensis]|uniref:DeoR/GlpR family DNA-binding transcription regulator n=1 Tax=Paenibacillus cisolokensis TaxID=1658519 RepID=UPI003D270F58